MADPVVQEIKDRLDVVEVIGSYLTLKRAGVNWKTNCPFHNEKTPSFNVNPGRQIWHCFGCGEGGDVFSFVQKYERLDFPETLKVLADKAGVRLPERTGFSKDNTDAKALLVRLNTFAAKYYHAFLLSKDGQEALRYLRNRGLSSATINTWEIGFAPARSGVLLQALQDKGVKLESLIEAGLVVRAEQARTYDRFYGRVTFPIYDFRGQVVGFSARLLQDRERAAKYVNSPESLVYRKGEVLFGLFQAKQEITNKGQVVVVEGQMDCVKAQQAGFGNTVATSGTAMTERQLVLLKRLATEVSFAFDADLAGQQALYKTSLLALPLGLDVKVIGFTGAKDPDELISKNPKAWQEAVEQAKPVVEHYVDQAVKNFTPLSLEQKRFLTSTVLPLVASLPSSLEQDHYLQSISQRFGLDQATLRTELKTSLSRQETGSTEILEDPVGYSLPDAALRSVKRVEQLVVGGLTKEEFRKIFLAEGQVGDFYLPEYRELAEVLLEGGVPSEEQKSILQEAEFVVESLGEEFDGNIERLVLELKKVFYTFRLTALRRNQENLTFRIKAAEVAKDNESVQALRKEFATLLGSRLELERKIEKYN